MSHDVSVRREIRLLYAFWLLRDFQLWIPVWIVFLTIERGFSLTQVTGAEGLFLIGIVVLEVPTGAVADRFGRSRSMALGAFCLGGAVLLFALTRSFPVLLASFMLWSLASALMSGADMALLFDLLKASGRTADYERTAGRGTACTWISIGLATALGGPIANLLDIRATIFIGAGTCLVTAMIALAMREPARVPATRPKPRYLPTIGAAFRELWRSPEVRRVVLMAGILIAAMDNFHYLIQPYLIDRGVQVGVAFSMLQVPIFVAGFGGALLAEPVRRRLGTNRILIVVPLAGGACYAALAATPGLAAYATFPLVAAVGSTIAPILSGYVNRRIDSERRATVLSIQGMVTSLTSAALVPSLGFATDNRGLPLAFLLGAATILVPLAVFGPGLLRRLDEGSFAATDADAAPISPA